MTLTRSGSSIAPVAAQADDPLTPLAGLEEQWAKLAAAEARVAEMERELEEMRERSARPTADAAKKPRPQLPATAPSRLHS